MAISGLIVLAPAFGLIALAIALDSRGPIFYRGPRIGRHGTPFKIVKFRTMVTGADRLGPGITIANDPRTTRIGRFLRWTKLDELPQLLNVLRGEMSMVGPRPEDPRYVSMYTAAQRRVLSVRPGITSRASVSLRHEERLLSGNAWERLYVQDILPRKLALDLEYVDHFTLWQDVQILWLTARELLRSA
jgi:lipopolysaccharide/colanic/teichoic acid biosynthesis glycosyltransferase